MFSLWWHGSHLDATLSQPPSATSSFDWHGVTCELVLCICSIGGDRNTDWEIGALGNITSATVVAASSFSMTLTDPRPLLQEIDSASYKSFLPHHDQGDLPAPDYVEPSLGPRNGNIKTDKPKSEQSAEPPKPDLAATGDGCIKSKVIRLGDFVDTDAVSYSLDR